MVYRNISEIDFAADDLPAIPLPRNVLFTSPEYFSVDYVINPHMEGNVGTVDAKKACLQWDALRGEYEKLDFRCHMIPGCPGLPDMVFCANQCLPFMTPSGERGVIPGRMYAPERRQEVVHFEKFFRRLCHRIIHIPFSVPGDFEGMGDAVWHPGRYFLWGGFGFRSDESALSYISESLNVPVVALGLTDPRFYHLDTCFCILDKETVLIYPGAFETRGLDMIHGMFSRVIEAPAAEALQLLACNAHAPDLKHVILQAGASETADRLEKCGYVPVEVETGEFLKAGGSVFCLKLMYW